MAARILAGVLFFAGLELVLAHNVVGAAAVAIHALFAFGGSVMSWAPEFVGRIALTRKIVNPFLLKLGVQIRYIFNENQTPRSESFSDPFETFDTHFLPQILEPRS